MDYQASPSVGFSKQEYWRGLPFPSPGDLPLKGIKPGPTELQADSLLSEPQEKTSLLLSPDLNIKQAFERCHQLLDWRFCTPTCPQASYNNSYHFQKAWASQVALAVKNLPAKAGDRRDTGSTPSLGRYPEEGHGNPLQHSCLENAMDREAWWATVYRVTKNQTWLKRLSMPVHT